MVAILLAWSIGVGHPALRECDAIELNHVYRGRCEAPELVQVIFWRWHFQHRGYVLRSHGFYLVTRAPTHAQFRRGCWEIDCGGKIVRAKLYRETHTDNDPEREDKLAAPRIDRFSPLEK